MTSIESKPAKETKNVDFTVNFDGRPGDEVIDKLLDDLKRHCTNLLVLSDKTGRSRSSECWWYTLSHTSSILVPWFPRHIQDLDKSVGETLDAGDALESDHPGFQDPTYRERRNALTQSAAKYRQGDPIPRIQYTQDEIQTWGAVYDRMQGLWKEYACDEFNEILPLLESHCGYSNDNIPQQQDISNFLKKKTGAWFH